MPTVNLSSFAGAGSQFFVCLTREQCQHLDNQYTAFGQVTNGMDVVEKIAASQVDARSGLPLKPIQMSRVIATGAK
jgi:peptidyl-prolyl cis-trans isomerase B (cyclophilin B)